MKIIGITGGTGAGKTTALNALRPFDVDIIDADAVYHQLTQDSLPMRQELEARFGAVYDESGVLERKKLGEMVFRDPASLGDLNEITHRHVKAEIGRRIAAAEAAGKAAVVIDAIELIGSGLGGLCDATIAVTAPMDLRIRRIMAREGIEESYARLRAEAQPSEEYFREHCDYELKNSEQDTTQSFAEKAVRLYRDIMSQ